MIFLCRLLHEVVMNEQTTENAWAERSKRFLNAKLKQADLSYEELATRLTEMGLPETKASIASKLARGRYSALFFFATMKAIGKDSVSLADL
jgi:hypothetical protein